MAAWRWKLVRSVSGRIFQDTSVVWVSVRVPITVRDRFTFGLIPNPLSRSLSLSLLINQDALSSISIKVFGFRVSVFIVVSVRCVAVVEVAFVCV